MELQLWQAIVLGIVEGITEYLPISSTGHLILASSLMGLDDTPLRQKAVDDFNIVIQGGAIAAVVGLYWPSILRMLKGLLGQDEPGLRLLINLVIAFLPAAFFGLLLKDQIEQYLFKPVPVLIALGLGGIYMMIADLKSSGRLGRSPLSPTPAAAPTVYDLTPKQALFIGLLQCIAMWPGTSRSMMTITGGIWCGMRPAQAAQFSFLLGLPTLLAATLLKLSSNLYRSHRDSTPNMFEVLGPLSCIVGIIVAAIFAAIAVKWLVAFLNKNGLSFFGWYRLALCAVMGFFIYTGHVQIAPPPSKTETLNSETRTAEPINWPQSTTNPK